MNGPTSIIRETAKGPASGETPISPDANSVSVRGTIANFGTPQGGPQTDEERLDAARASIQHVANVWIPPDIKAIFSPPTE